jgi:magnesium transporter
LQIAHDNIDDVIELVESFRETINSTRDLYMASISVQMNDTMRILTIFTAILLPLTLIPGIYGMYALDLTKIGTIPTGFLVVVLMMIIMATLLFWYFKRKQWIMSRDKDRIMQEE